MIGNLLTFSIRAAIFILATNIAVQDGFYIASRFLDSLFDSHTFTVFHEDWGWILQISIYIFILFWAIYSLSEFNNPYRFAARLDTNIRSFTRGIIEDIKHDYRRDREKERAADKEKEIHKIEEEILKIEETMLNVRGLLDKGILTSYEYTERVKPLKEEWSKKREYIENNSTAIE